MQTTSAEQAAVGRNETWIRNPEGAFGIWDRWATSTGIPIHEAYFVPDLRTLELGWWEERQCQAAFLKLAGFEGVSEARVTEIPAGKTLPPLKLAFDEGVYVVEGRGLTNIWSESSDRRISFEWQKHSLFLLPRHHHHQFSNVQGDRPARLFHFNYLPITMMSIPDPSFFFNNPYLGDDSHPDLAGLYSEAKVLERRPGQARGGNIWAGNFFPDMRAWDKLSGLGSRGAGGRGVAITFPGSPITSHMAVFGSFTYKKAHRHGPGVVIVIPAGEGFTVLWPEGKDKILVPWQEGSAFAPPDRWWHQHFNVGPTPARYLAIHALPALSTWNSNREETLAQDQIEYPDEDPWIRATFDAELAKRGLKSKMPDEAYRDRGYEWKTIDL